MGLGLVVVNTVFLEVFFSDKSGKAELKNALVVGLRAEDRSDSSEQRCACHTLEAHVLQTNGVIAGGSTDFPSGSESAAESITEQKKQRTQ